MTLNLKSFSYMGSIYKYKNCSVLGFSGTKTILKKFVLRHDIEKRINNQACSSKRTICN